MISNPKLVYNQNQKMKPRAVLQDIEVLISLVQDDSFVQSVRFNEDCYSSVSYLPYMVNDLKILCNW